MSQQQPCLPLIKKRRRNDGGDAPAAVVVHFDDWSTMNAHEYLSRVVAQANALPDCFTAAATDPDASAHKSTVRPSSARSHRQSPPTATLSSATAAFHLLSPAASLTPAPHQDVLPRAPRAWVDQVCGSFAKLRVHLQTLHAAGVGRHRPHPLPRLKDVADWHVYCVGQAEARGNVGNYFDDDDDDDEEADDNDEEDDDEPSPSTMDKGKRADLTPSWRTNLPATGHPPEATRLLQMDQVMVRCVLSHLVYFSSQGWSMTEARAAWAYALLARLETPLHREQAVVLYDWLKVLTAQRANIYHRQCQTVNRPSTDTSSVVARLNLLITILAIYLEQGGGFASTMQTAPVSAETGEPDGSSTTEATRT
jgi:survival of motor neuron protein-interacting protein 1